eukprot:CAMPEP_0172720204 /NCGR_PEP_ID=MMETSP1074-20121228/76393_1 /TAXON_ID=2916 /ORGANISM="Ceratium fusus, Strain PA161109" /LENGTH=165 /DNA_ID=CAMNT_0013545677 /DNA_START=57 /DNA_END=554 /DNA_ORIENTATION=+
MSASQQQPEEPEEPQAVPAPDPAPAPEEDNEEAEELEDMPPAEKEGDPLMGVRIRRAVEGTVFDAIVEEIERGKITGERLYRVKYSDGDLEHLTAKQVEECRVLDQAAAGSGEMVRNVQEQDDGGEEEETAPRVAKKPAARGPPVQATIAKKPAGPTVAKKPARA